MKYTSAEAAKLLKKINLKISDLLDAESKTYIFQAASIEDVESLRPDYNFRETQEELARLRSQLRTVKHAINVFNTTHTLPGFDDLTIDQALVYIPQVSARTATLHGMASRLPKERCSDYRSSGANYIDYVITNYDIDEAREAYEESADLLARLQLALDTVNTTETMEIDISES